MATAQKDFPPIDLRSQIKGNTPIRNGRSRGAKAALVTQHPADKEIRLLFPKQSPANVKSQVQRSVEPESTQFRSLNQGSEEEKPFQSLNTGEQSLMQPSNFSLTDMKQLISIPSKTRPLANKAQFNTYTQEQERNTKAAQFAYQDTSEESLLSAKGKKDNFPKAPTVTSKDSSVSSLKKPSRFGELPKISSSIDKFQFVSILEMPPKQPREAKPSNKTKPSGLKRSLLSKERTTPFDKSPKVSQVGSSIINLRREKSDNTRKVEKSSALDASVWKQSQLSVDTHLGASTQLRSKEDIEEKNAKFLNRMFKIICRDNQYLPQISSPHSEPSSDESRTTMFNRSPKKISLLSGKYRNSSRKLSSSKVLELRLKQKSDERKSSFSSERQSLKQSTTQMPNLSQPSLSQQTFPKPAEALGGDGGRFKLQNIVRIKEESKQPLIKRNPTPHFSTENLARSGTVLAEHLRKAIKSGKPLNSLMHIYSLQPRQLRKKTTSKEKKVSSKALSLKRNLLSRQSKHREHKAHSTERQLQQTSQSQVHREMSKTMQRVSTAMNTSQPLIQVSQPLATSHSRERKTRKDATKMSYAQLQAQKNALDLQKSLEVTRRKNNSLLRSQLLKRKLNPYASTNKLNLLSSSQNHLKMSELARRADRADRSSSREASLQKKKPSVLEKSEGKPSEETGSSSILKSHFARQLNASDVLLKSRQGVLPEQKIQLKIIKKLAEKDPASSWQVSSKFRSSNDAAAKPKGQPSSKPSRQTKIQKLVELQQLMTAYNFSRQNAQAISAMSSLKRTLNSSSEVGTRDKKKIPLKAKKEVAPAEAHPYKNALKYSSSQDLKPNNRYGDRGEHSGPRTLHSREHSRDSLVREDQNTSYPPTVIYYGDKGQTSESYIPPTAHLTSNFSSNASQMLVHEVTLRQENP